jgi:hypothetical protein
MEALTIIYIDMNKSIKNNDILVNLRHVQYARLVYHNQYGQSRQEACNLPSVRNESVLTSQYAQFHPDYPGETEYERAKRLNLLDIWTPHLYLKLTANSMLIYTGETALKIWGKWKNIVYAKEKK